MPIDLDALLLPISPDEPAGADIRYSPVTKKLREARRQEDDSAQGVWKRDVKTADFGFVLRTASETLSRQSKDLQVAAWLTEALVRVEGFAGLRQGLELVSRLLETFWDTVYPRIDEDGDLEMRAAALRWVGSQLDAPVKSISLLSSGHDWYQYRASRTVPSEEEANFNPNKKMQRDEALAENKPSPEEITQALEGTPPQFLQRRHDEILALLELVEKLQTYCDEKFGAASPALTPLRTSLEDVFQVARVLLKQKGVPEAAPEPLPASEPPFDASVYSPAETGWPPAVSPAPPPARRTTAPGVEPASVEDAMQQLVSAARYLRRETPHSPVPYLVARAIRWGELRANGAFPDLTQLQPPSTEVRLELKRLSTEGQWDAVREAAENSAAQPCGRAWLDLQRYSVNACRFAGLDAPAQAISSALKALLADFPGLPEWTLADDTPAANSETRQWLQEQGLLPAQPAPEVPPPPPPEPAWSYVPELAPSNPAPGQEEPLNPYELAMQAARSGRFEEAVGILSREIAHESSGRARFLRKSELARICMAAGQSEMGRPILQELSAEIERRGLEQWESGETLSQPLAMLYQCMNGEEDVARRELYARICRLDPPRVLQLPR